MRSKQYKWWEREVIYQIYPRSFKDSNGDGIGDLAGIMEKLDYLEKLGVKGIWISPIFPSPMADFGYDVSDYTGIHPIFGDMSDFDRLLNEVHTRDMKLILDFVPNHTSDQHPWFLQSKSSKENPKRDWYIWKDPKPDGGPPNNWLSEFGGGAWQFDQKTGQYYYHAFLKEQPDLNWRNPAVQEVMLDAMRFWLDKGVDGFRVDVMWHIIKDEQFRNDSPNPDYTEDMSPYKKLVPTYSADQPDVHTIVRMMRAVIEEYEERVLIGEIYLPVKRLMIYYGEENRGAHLPFNFQLIFLPWDARKIETAINEYEGSLPEEGWPNWVLGNHDKSRITSRVGRAQARIAAMLLLTLRGTPTMYYGDEIGMEDVPVLPEEVRDPQEINVPGKELGRDPERTPMQWDATKNAGFTSGKPWLPLMERYREVNVAKEWEEGGSILSLYRKLLRIRSTEPTLQIGDYVPIYSKGNLLSYLRKDGKNQFLVILNFSSSKEVFHDREMEPKGTILIATHPELEGREFDGPMELAADQGVLVRLKVSQENGG